MMPFFMCAVDYKDVHVPFVPSTRTKSICIQTTEIFLKSTFSPIKSRILVVRFQWDTYQTWMHLQSHCHHHTAKFQKTSFTLFLMKAKEVNKDSQVCLDGLVEDVTSLLQTRWCS